MAKKMNISSIFKKRERRAATWQWPSCTHSKTLSFRADDNIFKTMNSVFFDPFVGLETPESCFTNSTLESSASISAECHEECLEEEPLEMIIKGVIRSERLFFEPIDTSSILEEPKLGHEQKQEQEKEQEQEQEDELPFKESIVLAMESNDPYLDFKKSMKEMVESDQGIKEWECLQELLAWYLKMNGKVNHRFIIGAFVDLLIELAAAAPPLPCSTISESVSSSYSSVASSSFSCPSSPLSFLGHKEIEDQENGDQVS